MSIADYVSRYNVFRQGDRIGSRFWIGPDKEEAMASQAGNLGIPD
nr:MAG TPA: hypothetical protein [Caudoviricetes sp.]